MVDLRNKMFGFRSKGQKRKICPVISPVIYTKIIQDEGGKTVAVPEIAPIVCFGEECEIFCEIHEMCIYKCDHLEIVHGFGIVEDDEEGGCQSI